MNCNELRYHHLGIPTNVKQNDETYLEQFKVYVSGYEKSPYKIEWMRYEADSPVNEIVKTIPHVAFQVDDLEEAIKCQEILIEPNNPSPGIRVAFILFNGAPVEFIQVSNSND